MSLISKIVTLITMILFPSLKGAIEKREKLYKSVPASDIVVNNSGAWLKKEIIPRKWVDGTIRMEFEGITVNVSDKYDEWLTYVYGDYMSLPPENERVGHHYVDIFDMNDVDLKKSPLIKALVFNIIFSHGNISCITPSSLV